MFMHHYTIQPFFLNVTSFADVKVNNEWKLLTKLTLLLCEYVSIYVDRPTSGIHRYISI